MRFALMGLMYLLWKQENSDSFKPENTIIQLVWMENEQAGRQLLDFGKRNT